MSCRDLSFNVKILRFTFGSVSCDYYRISIFWFYCGGHLVRHFVFFNSKRPRDISSFNRSQYKNTFMWRSSDILSDLVVILDSILYFLALAVREIGRMSSSFKKSQRKVLLCRGLLGGPV